MKVSVKNGHWSVHTPEPIVSVNSALVEKYCNPIRLAAYPAYLPHYNLIKAAITTNHYHKQAGLLDVETENKT